MATIDPEQERLRLVEFYSYQMDGELEKVAGQAYDLTDVAREALRAEMSVFQMVCTCRMAPASGRAR